MARFPSVRSIALLALLAALIACGKQPPAVEAGSDPVAAVAALSSSLRDNDLQRFYGLSVPLELRQRTEAAYDAKRAALPPADPKEREEFAHTMAKLTAPDAEDVLYAELEPALVKLEAEVANQLPLMVAMGSGFASAAINESETLSADEKQHASSVLAALTGWATTAPVADRAKARAAIAAVTASARAMQISDLDTLRTLDMNDALVKGGLALAGLKQVAALYGLEFDPALDSVKPELLSRDNDNARVKVSYTLLGKPVSFEMAMLQRDGNWYSADAVTRAEAALAAATHNGVVADAPDTGTQPEAEAAPAPTAPAPGN